MPVYEARSLNIDQLLEPIPGESVGGDEHAYLRQLRDSLYSLRKPENPRDETDTSYRRYADWSQIVELADIALRTQTKDLRIVCHIVEAWTQLNGFAGLSQGLSLLSQFIDRCWECCYPSIDDGDFEARSLPLENMLDDDERGICFPATVRSLQLLGNSSDPINYFDYQQLKKQPASVAESQLCEILTNTGTVQYTQLVNDVEQALENLTELKVLLDARLGDYAPGLTRLRGALVDCQRVIRIHSAELLSDTSVDNDPTFTEEANLNAPSSESCYANSSSIDEPRPTRFAGQTPGEHPTRDQIYRQLADSAEYLRKIEPHSPIPYLVKRAVELGQLEFPELVTRLVREDSILNELRREFGITHVDEEAT